MYAPFHRLSGVQYHALSLCVGGKTWCGAGGAGRGGAKLPVAYKRQKFSGMQLSGSGLGLGLGSGFGFGFGLVSGLGF